MSFQLAKLEITYKAVDDIDLPSFSGSTFRGVFGHSLKKLSCISLDDNCINCPLSPECIYTNIFESRHTKINYKSFMGSNSPPTPFIIRPTASMKSNIYKNNDFKLELIVFGEFTNWVHYFLKALQIMGNNGAGKGNGKFKLIEVVNKYTNQIIYDGDHYLFHDFTKKISFSMNPINYLNVNILSPIRIIKKNKMVNLFTPQIFFNEFSRRIKTINHYYGSSDLTFNYSDLLKETELITMKNRTKIKKISRYSNRQHKHVPITGIVGDLEFNNLGPVTYNLLKAVEDIHIGKGTSYGLGQIEVKN